MHQIIFSSRAARCLSSDDIWLLCDRSWQRNAAEQVTGLFLCDGARFLCALEGERKVVENTFARIMSDGRHFGVDILSRRDVRHREFDRSPMSCLLFQDHAGVANVLDSVKSSVANLTDIKSRAYFIGFAKFLR
ncbi:BLUF domain-containing protein [Sphingomonas sp. RHCKR7]|nr:BLUF domain-containing protein [Sphingomonas folli]